MSGDNIDMSHAGSSGRNLLYGVALAQFPDTDGDVKLWAKHPSPARSVTLHGRSLHGHTPAPADLRPSVSALLFEFQKDFTRRRNPRVKNIHLPCRQLGLDSCRPYSTPSSGNADHDDIRCALCVIADK